MVSHLALKMGLHRPEFAHEFKDINNAFDRAQYGHERWPTWLACQFVEHMLASKNGVPSGIRFDWPSNYKLRNQESPAQKRLSPILRHHIQLCAIRDRHLTAIAYQGQTLSGLRSSKDREGYLNLYHAELDDFEAAESPLDTLSAVFLNMSRVTIAGFCLARDMVPCGHQLRMLIRSGLDSATKILDLVAPLAWETLPVHVLRSLLYAGVFASHLARYDMDIFSTEPMAVLERATDILRHLAHGQDFPTRAKIVLETELDRHSQRASTTQKRQPGVEFQTRMEANMYWDLVESDKSRHNWNQTADDIYWELVLSGANPISPKGLTSPFATD
ncbi:hypothetical protein PRZ48_006954 [Zasmidium cellare]|uniref:Uncharacterized protein n=1 Tax=Zasmidium cellare TaxID=395010 RepID=A0ABR0EJ50_ZASCE|nr:hypothetical protein PRZ48_006954 [Zasmidium cellare]